MNEQRSYRHLRAAGAAFLVAALIITELTILGRNTLGIPVLACIGEGLLGGYLGASIICGGIVYIGYIRKQKTAIKILSIVLLSLRLSCFLSPAL